MEVIGSGLNIDETRAGGSSSLPRKAGKRVQGVVAPFQERLVNERRL